YASWLGRGTTLSYTLSLHDALPISEHGELVAAGVTPAGLGNDDLGPRRVDRLRGRRVAEGARQSVRDGLVRQPDDPVGVPVGVGGEQRVDVRHRAARILRTVQQRGGDGVVIAHLGVDEGDGGLVAVRVAEHAVGRPVRLRGAAADVRPVGAGIAAVGDAVADLLHRGRSAQFGESVVVRLGPGAKKRLRVRPRGWWVLDLGRLIGAPAGPTAVTATAGPAAAPAGLRCRRAGRIRRRG